MQSIFGSVSAADGAERFNIATPPVCKSPDAGGAAAMNPSGRASGVLPIPPKATAGAEASAPTQAGLKPIFIAEKPEDANKWTCEVCCTKWPQVS